VEGKLLLTFARSPARGAAALALALLTSCQSLSQGRLVPEDLPQQSLPAETAFSPSSPPPRRVEQPPSENPAPPARPRLYPGTGVFIRTPTEPAVPGTRPEGDITLNFVDADVREVVRSVVGDVLHMNFSIDPRVQGTVTVQTSRPLRREDVLPTLVEVLRASGLALVQRDGIYRLVPLDEAARGAGPPGTTPTGRPQAGYAIQVVPLRYVSAGELAHMLEPYVPKGASIQVDAARNMLIVSGTGADLQALSELIATFDVDFLAGMSFGIFPLQNGTAKSIASDLGTVFGSGSGSALGGALRFVPLERINSILVISPQQSYLRQAGSWIERLDRGDENTPRIFEYRVQNSRAADLAHVLSQLFSTGQVHVVNADVAPGQTPLQIASTGQTANGGAPASAPQPAAAPFPQQQPQPGQQPADQPGAPQGPQSSQQGDAGFSSSGRGDDELAPPRARIVADEKNNALVIYAKPRD